MRRICAASYTSKRNAGSELSRTSGVDCRAGIAAISGWTFQDQWRASSKRPGSVEGEFSAMTDHGSRTDPKSVRVSCEFRLILGADPRALCTDGRLPALGASQTVSLS